ncbi:MAG: hypothetical protein ACFFER_17085 [Candidatus Thorarchaeota archaeon]
MSSALKKPGPREFLAILWLIILISTWVIWNSTGSTYYGASHTTLKAGEIKIIWWQAPTSSDETLVMRYETELEPIDLYVVSQDSYNRTSGELPTSYYLFYHGNDTELILEGPLPKLYRIVVSEVVQEFTSQTWAYSSAALQARALAYPITIVLIVVTGVNLGWYWKTRNASQDREPDLV